MGRAMQSRSHAYVLHYACEGFESPDRRITAIAARNLGTGATQSFEIETSLRRAGLDPATATAQDLDRAEKAVLDAFYDFVAHKLNGTYWLHWNMRNATFGFPALENRHRLLGGQPLSVPDAQRLDLAARMIDLYGDGYADIENRLRSLAARNGLAMKHLIDGADQAAALRRRDFATVDRSLLNKVDLMYAIATKANEGTLKTHAGMFDGLGGIGGAVAWIREHPAIAACAAVAPVFGAIVGAAKLWGLLTGVA
jgi:hypothetical protein